MKIYDKKKFWSGLGILAIGILFFFYDLSSPSANGLQAKWNLILGLIVMAFGIADSARALSRKKTREARIEQMDERNQLVRLASKAKTLDIMQVLLFVVMVASLVGLKKTGYLPFAGMALAAGLFVVLVIFIELFVGMYYEEKKEGRGEEPCQSICALFTMNGMTKLMPIPKAVRGILWWSVLKSLQFCVW